MTPASAQPGAPVGAPVPVLDTATGTSAVPPGTPAGTYLITYKLCEKLNPSNCDNAVASVTVDPSQIVATNDSYTGINGASGNPSVGNALPNDKVNGQSATVGPTGNATLAVTTPAAPLPSAPPGNTNVPVLDTLTGNVSVPAMHQQVHTPSATICAKKLNPTNCKPATITVTVDVPPIVATNDNFGSVNGTNKPECWQCIFGRHGQ